MSDTDREYLGPDDKWHTLLELGYILLAKGIDWRELPLTVQCRLTNDPHKTFDVQINFEVIDHS